MPIYDYRCSKCKFSPTLAHTVAECDKPHFCPWCKADGDEIEMQRMIRVPLAVFPNGMKPGLTIADHKTRKK